MPREDRIRVLHMIEAIEAIASFLAGRGRQDLNRDQMFRFAVVHAIGILGEAGSKVSPETRALTPQVPWRIIIAMRNRLIHGYADIDREVVWKTATEDVPSLLPILRALIPAEE